MIINAEKLVLGRMATTIAKKALLGEEVIVVNCEKAIVKSPDRSKKDYLQKMDIGQPQQGPFVLRRPDLFVRRVIRGMLPYKKTRGRNAYSRVKCYIGIPENVDSKNMETVDTAQTEMRATYKTVKQLCESIGGRT